MGRVLSHSSERAELTTDKGMEKKEKHFCRDSLYTRQFQRKCNVNKTQTIYINSRKVLSRFSRFNDSSMKQTTQC